MARPQSAAEEVIYQLVQHIKTAVPEFAQVLEDFPDSNIQLKFPTLTIVSGNPQFTNLMPYPLSATDPNDANQMTTAWISGEYDFTFQLDLWTRNKLERTAFYEKLLQALNPEIDPMGLRLQLSNYFGIWATYTLTGYNFEDSQVSSQRQEWRATLTLVANCRAVLQHTDYAMIDIETQLETPDTIS